MLSGAFLNYQELVIDMEHYEKRLKSLGEQATKLLDRHGAALLSTQLELAVHLALALFYGSQWSTACEIEGNSIDPHVCLAAVGQGDNL